MRKFATLRNEILNINLNGLELRCRADKVDFMFGDGDPIIRWCVNHAISCLDVQRQKSFDADMEEICVSHNSVAKLPEGMTLNINICLREEEDVMKWPSYMRKGSEGTCWRIHGEEFDNFNPRENEYPHYEENY